MRPVINLKELNTYVAPHHFKMEGLHTLKDLLKTGDWMTKVDLKDAYFMIPIHSSDRSALCFQVQSCHYQYTCLPFGLSCAPWVFTKTLKPVLTLLRELGVRLVAYIDDVLILGEGKRPHEWSDISTGEFGFPSPPGENSARANSGDRIPGNDSRFKDERTAPTWPEIEKDKAGGCKDQRSTSHTLCPGGVTPTREIQLSFPGSASRSSLQQSSTEGPSHSLGVGRPMLRNPVPPLPCSKGGAGVVGQPVVPVEWEESGAETARPSNRIRRIPHRLGSSMPGDADRGTMVPAGEVPPHQLPRAPGSNASGENVPERSRRQESFAAARQPDSSDLHKQSGQDSLRPGHNNGERALDVVPTKGYPSDSTTSARSGEREGRHRVQSDEGLLRLHVEPKVFSTNPGSFPTPGG